MIFAKGTILPPEQLPQVLERLPEDLIAVRSQPPLTSKVVIDACQRLLERLDRGELDGLIAQYATPQLLSALEQYRYLLRPESLEYKLSVETGGLLSVEDRPFGRTAAVPLGTLLHITAGNLDGLPAFSVVEGLLTGNVNLLKLPSGDSGLSLALLKLLTDTEPKLAPYVYVFSIPSSDKVSLQALANLSDGIVTWGGDEAIRAMRAMAPAGCKLMEWGHRLSFAYLSGEGRGEELEALAGHIIQTGGLLCSSCQVIYLDTADLDRARHFCQSFLPILERAAAQGHQTPGQAAMATLHGYEHRLELAVEGSSAEVFQGRGCSVTLCPDRALELSPLHGNVLVKCLPRNELAAALFSQRGRLQTVGLLCPPQERRELCQRLSRAGVTRITTAAHMSEPFLGECHDGEYPLRRYLRLVDVEAPL
ncbi:acyl-CoA reductase [Lawsonibacter sp. LCP25S3_G6]|uniref:acyl-CoA reductase n=1 Tax=unclassified Lawsonibacter TaxID=2617946 RepID=UPI003F9E916B